MWHKFCIAKGEGGRRFCNTIKLTELALRNFWRSYFFFLGNFQIWLHHDPPLFIIYLEGSRSSSLIGKHNLFPVNIAMYLFNTNFCIVYSSWTWTGSSVNKFTIDSSIHNSFPSRTHWLQYSEVFTKHWSDIHKAINHKRKKEVSC